MPHIKPHMTPGSPRQPESPTKPEPLTADEIRKMSRVDTLPSERAKVAHELHEGEHAIHSVTILRPVSEVYAFVRDFANFPKFTKHLEKVELVSAARTRWTWKGPGGVAVEWESEVIAEIQDRMVSWQTLPGAIVSQAGSAWFKPAPQDGGTEIHLQVRYHVPGGKIAQKLVQRIAGVFGQDPSQALHEDLRRLKRLLESGEIPTTEGQPHGSRGLLH